MSPRFNDTIDKVFSSFLLITFFKQVLNIIEADTVLHCYHSKSFLWPSVRPPEPAEYIIFFSFSVFSCVKLQRSHTLSCREKDWGSCDRAAYIFATLWWNWGRECCSVHNLDATWKQGMIQKKEINACKVLQASGDLAQRQVLGSEFDPQLKKEVLQLMKTITHCRKKWILVLHRDNVHPEGDYQSTGLGSQSRDQLRDWNLSFSAYECEIRGKLLNLSVFSVPSFPKCNPNLHSLWHSAQSRHHGMLLVSAVFAVWRMWVSLL